MRLTWRRADGEVCPRVEKGADIYYIAGEFTQKVYDKLAAYEDTGLEPEAIDGLRLSLCGAISMSIAEEQGYVEVNRAQEIAHAEAEGRLVILPCKVRDAVYYLNPFNEIENGKITMIQQKADGTWKFRVTTDFSRDVTTDAIGKTVFLTREEAEVALKGGWQDV